MTARGTGGTAVDEFAGDHKSDASLVQQRNRRGLEILRRHTELQQDLRYAVPSTGGDAPVGMDDIGVGGSTSQSSIRLLDRTLDPGKVTLMATL